MKQSPRSNPGSAGSDITRRAGLKEPWPVKQSESRQLPFGPWVAGVAAIALVLFLAGWVGYRTLHRSSSVVESPRNSGAGNTRTRGRDEVPQRGAEGGSAPKLPNALIPQEEQTGWKLLFDGKTTKGWRVHNRQTVPAQWKVEGGAPVLTGQIPCPERCDLIAEEQNEDFELGVEWKIVAGGNSGVMYRVAETKGLPSTTGPEYELIDDDSNSDGLNPITRTASCFGL